MKNKVDNMSIKDDLLKRLFYQMLRIRMVEEKIVDEYPKQEMRCPVHLCIGQEAIPVGVCASLTSDDYVMSTHRSHGHYLAKGGDLKAMLAEFYGKKDGCSGGRGGSMHLIDLAVGFLGSVSIVAGSIPIGVGAAFSTMMQKQNRITAIFFGDAATEEGVFHESLNFASLKKLPIIFVCENNLYSVYSPLNVRQPEGQRIHELARAHGIKTFCGNGNDVIDVFTKSQKALEIIRQGHGPVFLEFDTYRWREHCGTNYDNHIGYRTEEEFQSWKIKCPVENMRLSLLELAIITEAELKESTINIKDEIKAAFDFAKKNPFPESIACQNHVYA